MSIACPYCKATLKIKALKPGRYRPQCPKCNDPFLVTIPPDETGTIKVEPIKKPAASDLPDTLRLASPDTTAKLPTTSPRPPAKTAPPEAQTDIIVKGRSGAKTPPPQDGIEDAAAAMLNDDEPGEAPPGKPKA
jgi:hypothetical protein